MGEWLEAAADRERHEFVYGTAFWCPACFVCFEPSEATISMTEGEEPVVRIDQERREVNFRASLSGSEE